LPLGVEILTLQNHNIWACLENLLAYLVICGYIKPLLEGLVSLSAGVSQIRQKINLL